MAATALVSVVATPAAGDHNVIGPHWPLYRWDGVPGPPRTRAFFVFDRSGREDVWAALNEVVDEWNRIPEVVRAAGRIPFMATFRDGANEGQCPDGGLDLEDRYSVTLLCFDPNLRNRGLGGPLYPGKPDFHYTSSLVGGGLVRIGPSAAASFELLKTVLRHELGHAMGLEHSGACDALMSSPDRGGCVPPAGRTWTAHDLAAVENFYLPHPLD